MVWIGRLSSCWFRFTLTAIAPTICFEHRDGQETIRMNGRVNTVYLSSIENWISVNVSGESPAAMQHGCSARQLSSTVLFFLSVAMAVATNVKTQRNIWSFIYGVT